MSNPGPINSDLNPRTASNNLKEILEMQKSKFEEIETYCWQKESVKIGAKFRGRVVLSSYSSSVGILYVGKAQLRTLAN